MISQEQFLLSKLYECQEIMEKTLDKGDKDPHYFLMQILIERLEKFIQENNQDILG